MYRHVDRFSQGKKAFESDVLVGTRERERGSVLILSTSLSIGSRRDDKEEEAEKPTEIITLKEEGRETDEQSDTMTTISLPVSIVGKS